MQATVVISQHVPDPAEGCSNNSIVVPVQAQGRLNAAMLVCMRSQWELLGANYGKKARRRGRLTPGVIGWESLRGAPRLWHSLPRYLKG
jgi:hypothetical protein